MNKAHRNAVKYQGKRVKVLRVFHNKDPVWETGTIVGGWEDNEQDGVKVKFDTDGEIQEIPFDYVELQ